MPLSVVCFVLDKDHFSASSSSGSLRISASLPLWLPRRLWFLRSRHSRLAAVKALSSLSIVNTVSCLLVWSVICNCLEFVPRPALPLIISPGFSSVFFSIKRNARKDVCNAVGFSGVLKKKTALVLSATQNCNDAAGDPAVHPL